MSSVLSGAMTWVMGVAVVLALGCSHDLARLQRDAGAADAAVTEAGPDASD
jgi:hypothetical protein